MRARSVTSTWAEAFCERAGQGYAEQNVIAACVLANRSRSAMLSAPRCLRVGRKPVLWLQGTLIAMDAATDSRKQGIALIEEVIDELSSISARAMGGTVDEDPSAVYNACGDMQLKLQQAIELLQAFPREATP